MRPQLEAVVGNHGIYEARRDEYRTGQKIPFRVSPTPLVLSPEQKKEVGKIGPDITGYFRAIDELHKTDERVREILDTNKPAIFLVDTPIDYLFLRPDMVITPKGFSINEVETSPFGLALAEMLNRGYRGEGFETMVGDTALTDHVHASTPATGEIIYTPHTQQYAGQMTFLADEVFSGNDRRWTASPAKERKDTPGSVYRGFYLSEYDSDPDVKLLLESKIAGKQSISPSPTPHMEEKAVLSFIWDKRFENHLRERLGPAAFNHLRGVIPPTWIVGQEQFFAPGMPNNMDTSLGLATLSRSKRTFVLKSSGFDASSSWAQGVHFLHEKSAVDSYEILTNAQKARGLHVIQEFTGGLSTPMNYDEDGNITPMSAKIRLTPYFSAKGKKEGELVAIKATGCERTDYIHAGSSSINTAVA